MQQLIHYTFKYILNIKLRCLGERSLLSLPRVKQKLELLLDLVTQYVALLLKFVFLLFAAKCIIVDSRSMDLLPVGHILHNNYNMLVVSPRQCPTVLEDLGNPISNWKLLS